MLVILYMNQCSTRVQYKTPMQMQTIPENALVLSVESVTSCILSK
jgi:hypothetical protein